MEKKFDYTFGALDGITVDGNVVSASGWVVGLEGDITDLSLACDGHRLTIEDIKLNSPSPDVHQAWPDLPHTANCRFRIVGELPGGTSQIGAGRLFSVIPMVNNRHGVLLERIGPLRLPVPSPEQSVTVGHGDFVETSFSMLSLFRQIGDLERSARVLDPGCGIGRMAYALFHYLDGNGRYDGFDVSAEAIGIAKSIFSGRDNFDFQHVGLYNKMYNQLAESRASDFVFPFPSNNFDFVIMTSVFTHLLPDEVRNYLAEISRTLVSGGRCFATFFVVDDVAKANLRSGKASLNIVHELTKDCFVENPDVPENAVAYDYSALSGMISDAGLTVEQVHWGKWSARSTFLSYQDVFLLRKK